MPKYRVTGTLLFDDGSPSFDLDRVETAPTPSAAISAALALWKRLPAVETVDNVEVRLYNEEAVEA